MEFLCKIYIVCAVIKFFKIMLLLIFTDTKNTLLSDQYAHILIFPRV